MTKAYCPGKTLNWLIGKDLDAEKDWRQEKEGNDRGWDGWMASPTPQIWIWASSGSWWWTGRPGVLQSIGLWRVRHDWATELNWTDPTLGEGIFPTQGPPRFPLSPKKGWKAQKTLVKVMTQGNGPIKRMRCNHIIEGFLCPTTYPLQTGI